MESCLEEMPVVSQGCRQSLFFHDQETGAVGEAPAFVGHVFVPLDRLFEKLARLRDDNDFGSISKRLGSAGRGLSQTGP